MPKSFRQLSKLLTDSSSADMTVNGSATAVNFVLQPPTGVLFRVHSLILTFHSTSMDLSSAVDQRVFGASGLLTSGLKVFHTRGQPLVDVDVFPTTVKRLVDFYRYSSWSGSGVQVSGHTDGVAAGTDHLVVAISWGESTPLEIRPNSVDALTVRVQDDLSALTLFEAHAIGVQSKIS